jgi:D-glycerate 3-kinase
LTHKAQAALSDFIKTEKLPDSFQQSVEQWYMPLLKDIENRIAQHKGVFVLGIHGCQGSGKSTLAALLVLLLREILNINSVNLSLDDFYLTRAEREKLASDIHPLLITRGVPGTHDVALAMQTIDEIKQQKAVAIPRFNKAIDDRFPASEWTQVKNGIDVIILEGWCLSVEPQKSADLDSALNSLEADEDDHAIWRSYVNKKLTDEYQQLFALLDMLVMLKAPDFSNVIDWRLQQEEKLRARNKDLAANQLMDKNALVRFISHYERLTRHALETVPAIADVVFQLNADQTIEVKLKG